MIDRAREIVKMMGYKSIDETLEAIGAGDLILLKMPSDDREEVGDWLRGQVPQVRDEDGRLADLLQDVAEGLELASELERYPADSDICDLDLPHGWPSYCERALPE